MSGAMKWTCEEKKAFEVAMEKLPDSPENLKKIAKRMEKPVAEIEYHYEKWFDTKLLESDGDVVPEYSPRSPTTIAPKKWTLDEKKALELAVVTMEIPDLPEKMEFIAAQMKKPVEEIRYHYEKLVQDAVNIESGGDVVPEFSPHSPTSIVPNKRKRSAWSFHEHELFLEGLKSEGQGKWEAISTKFVKTKDPTQVRIHAYSYSSKKNKKQD